MPRTVTPLGLMSSKMPQIFSLGECKLTITMELGFMASLFVSFFKFSVWAWAIGGSGYESDQEETVCPPCSFCRDLVGVVQPEERIA